LGIAVAEVIFVAGLCMVAVGMGNNGLIYGLPGINIKLTGWSVKTSIGKFNDGRHDSRNL